jgi:ribonuclease H / adenosylcobalamin/alpha-ribazole phosphatase
MGAALGWVAPSGGATTTLLLRHGDSRLSPEHRFSGVGDVELSEAGVLQAKSAARRLRSHGGVDAVVSSPLRRARQTATIVGAELGLPVAVEDGLRENDFGSWEGLTLAEIRDRWPAECSAWMSDPHRAAPGGESLADTASRAERSHRELLRRYAGSTVVVVSHITPIKALVRVALQAPLSVLYRLYLGSACLTEIAWYGDGLAVIRCLNDTSHLPGTAT